MTMVLLYGKLHACRNPATGQGRRFQDRISEVMDLIGERLFKIQQSGTEDEAD